MHLPNKKAQVRLDWTGALLRDDKYAQGSLHILADCCYLRNSLVYTKSLVRSKAEATLAVCKKKISRAPSN